MLADAAEQPVVAMPRRSGGASRRLPLFVVCSPRPRVGRTLIARLLVDYFAHDGRDIIPFDANPDDPVLTAYLPGRTVSATVADTRGEIRLFDRLIDHDGLAKVIDLAPALFDRFFDSAATTAFVDKAGSNGIDTVALFPIEDHPHAIAAYRGLVERFPAMTVVPVVNELLFANGLAEMPLPTGGEPPLRIATLSPMLHGVVMRPRFSFGDYVERHSGHLTPLHDWIARCFVGFRQIELRLQMSAFADLFRLEG